MLISRYIESLSHTCHEGSAYWIPWYLCSVWLHGCMTDRHYLCPTHTEWSASSSRYHIITSRDSPYPYRELTSPTRRDTSVCCRITQSDTHRSAPHTLCAHSTHEDRTVETSSWYTRMRKVKKILTFKMSSILCTSLQIYTLFPDSSAVEQPAVNR